MWYRGKYSLAMKKEVLIVINASVFVKDSPKNDKAFYLILIFYLIYDYTACASLNARATTAF